MKANFVCFKLSKLMVAFILIICIQMIFIIWGLKEMRETSNFEQMKNDAVNISKKEMGLQPRNNNSDQEINPKDKNDSLKQKNEINQEIGKSKQEPKAYANMPEEQKGYKVIGKIEIPKLKLSSYILEETNKKSLKVSVTKLYGPEINQIGNFCIAGHNYRNNKMFGGIKKLDKGDEIILTDPYDKTVKYEVYDTYKTSPSDVSCLTQNTDSERELTLITCTTGAIQRVIVKAVEIYD